MDARGYVDQWSDLMVEILKSDIELANSLNDQCWSLYTGGTGVVFGVGKATLMYRASNNRFYLLLDVTQLSAETTETIRIHKTLGDWALGARLTETEFFQHKDELIAAHHAVIHRLSSEKNNRWKWFRKDYYEAFSKRLGKELPKPGYYDTIRGSGSTASNLYPLPQWVAELFIRLIKVAHDINPNSWSIYFKRNKPILSVRAEYLLTYPQGQDKGLLTINLIEPHAQGPLKDVAEVGFGGKWKRFDAYGYWEVPEGLVRDRLNALLPSMEEAVARAARAVRTLTSYAKLFDESLLEEIESSSGMSAPRPAYLADSASDLSKDRDVFMPPSSVEITTDLISSQFAAGGLNYTDTQIADSYTALQTKGFVVLSGISGTGKSKIAQGFTTLLPDGPASSLVIAEPRSDDDKRIKFPYIHRYNTIVILARAEPEFPLVERGHPLPTIIRFKGIDYAARLYRDDTLNLSWRKELGAQVAKVSVGTPFELTPHYSTNEEGEEKLSFVEFVADTGKANAPLEATFANRLFIPVRPDWRDSTSMLGYYNPLTQTYEWTDFLRFILNAADNFRGEERVAWFVILDEMNLAHVEYYFADLLSVLESGKVEDKESDDYGFTREPLRISYPDTIVSEVPPTEIYLPPNLYIIGTVNMDETTHAFSPKVLDRAFTMELTEVDFSDYPRERPDDDDIAVIESDKVHFLQAFSQNGLYPQIRKDEISEFVKDNDHIRASLQRLNESLAVHRFHFGYRVFDEIVQFLINADENQMYPDEITAMDSAAFMKILPKFGGSEARVGIPLKLLIAWANDPFNIGDGATGLNRTLDWAIFMDQTLQAHGFVTAF